ncbi:MAG: polysaccharide biosynthesis/export family protein [Bacteroidales bacterium]|nr:polysaccharide biosynthesis/export family protein [Bacteroidales bacterium]MCD8393290.1 polysaccharide biosynthesis/export family protein [Bacteroidales bacterium]
MRKSIYNILMALVCVGALCSCSSGKNTSLIYFEDLKAAGDGQIPVGTYELRIVPDDELMITVTSLVPDASVEFNLPVINPAERASASVQSNPKQQTYIVDNQGYINFPVLGKIKVEGMTTQELTHYLEDRIGESVDSPIVRVEMLSFRVNVLGEVKSPGKKTVATERFTLLDALALAGDLTEYGERENVLLIRNENGKLIYHHFNLNDSKTMESPYFFLKQNDVIIVEPNKIRKDNSKYNQFNAYKISVISTVVSACSVIASLVIALTVK